MKVHHQDELGNISLCEKDLHLDIISFFNKLFSCKFLNQFVNLAKNKKQTKKIILLYALGQCLIH